MTKLKQALVTKTISAGGSFRSADCPECGKFNLLSYEKPDTTLNKVFCPCGCIFQLVSTLDVVDKE